MGKSLRFDKGRYNAIPVHLNTNITGWTLVAECRAGPSDDSELLFTWTITVTNAAAGELELSYNDSASALNPPAVGWTDLKRVTGAGDISQFDEPLAVDFKGMPTA